MIRGLYTAAAGMITQQRRHDTATQNLANINTPGYKQVTSVQRSFPEVLVSMVGGQTDNPNRELGKLNTGVIAEESMAMYKQGIITQSDSPSDFALVSDIAVKDPTTGNDIVFDEAGKSISADGEVTYKPEAFFKVMDSQGQFRYTKDGSFKVSKDGHLLTSTGYQVLDSNNKPIIIKDSAAGFQVDDQGNIVSPSNGKPVPDKLNIAVIQQPFQMVREGNGVFRIDDTEAAGVRTLAEGEQVKLRQGYVESSNVNSSEAIIDMNTAVRAYEANQKIVQFYDRSLIRQ